jgi:hypothetical protein
MIGLGCGDMLDRMLARHRSANQKPGQQNNGIQAAAVPASKSTPKLGFSVLFQ